MNNDTMNDHYSLNCIYFKNLMKNNRRKALFKNMDRPLFNARFSLKEYCIDFERLTVCEFNLKIGLAFKE